MGPTEKPPPTSGETTIPTEKPPPTSEMEEEVGPIGDVLREIGKPGDRGEQGKQGDLGEQGEQGDAGQNMYCDQYCDGIEMGEKGERGEQGAQGLKGNSGEKGVMGPSGEDGENRTPGTRGSNGSQGLKGDTGALGTPGKNGRRGGCDAGTRSSCDLRLGKCYGISSIRLSVKCRPGYAATSIWNNTRFWGLRCCEVIGGALGGEDL